MKNAKRLLCMILSLTVVLSTAACLCMPASAGSTIETVSVNGIVVPRTEACPVTTGISVPAGSNYEFTNTTKQMIEYFTEGYGGAEIWFDNTDWKWLTKTDTFKEGHVCKITLSFWPKEGYAFAEPSKMHFDAGALASDVKTAVFYPSGIHDGRIVLEITFNPVAPPKTITSLNVTGITRPIIGDPVSTDAVQVSEGFSILSKTLQINDGGHWKTATGQYKAEDVYRMDLQMDTLPGYLYADQISATVNGGKLDGFGNTIELKKVGGIYRMYFLLEQPTMRMFKIDRYPQSRTVDYRSTILMETASDGPTEGLYVEWVVTWDDGSESRSTGETLRLNNVKRSFSAQAWLLGKENGDPVVYAFTAKVQIVVRNGFFDRVKAFFRSLFGRLPVVTQEFLGVEICE